jgi:hypothetical protein
VRTGSTWPSSVARVQLVACVYCSRCILQPVYTAAGVYCSRCILQPVYTAAGVYCSRCILQLVSTAACVSSPWSSRMGESTHRRPGHVHCESWRDMCTASRGWVVCIVAIDFSPRRASLIPWRGVGGSRVLTGHGGIWGFRVPICPSPRTPASTTHRHPRALVRTTLRIHPVSESLRALQQQRPPRRTRRRVQPQPRCRAGDAKKQCSFPCHSQTLGHVQPCLPGVPCKSRVLDASLVFARAGAGPSYSTPCLLRTEHTTTLLAP